MKIRSTFEQGIYVIIILALAKDHRPIKSNAMSELLAVSDSYLKKILMKLSRSGLVVSSASKRGGYTLSRKADEISLKDVFDALEADQEIFTQSHYAEKLFPGQAHVKDAEEKIGQVIASGLSAFADRLGGLSISDLLLDGAWQNGAIDWDKRLEGRKNLNTKN